MNEQVFRYGNTNQGFGISSLPEVMEGAPVLVLLNAGLLHREEPYRLNVLVSRALASMGYICIRVDLAGKGDTPESSEMTNRESVAQDWSNISKAIEAQFGERAVLILGLCSGADNAIKLTAEDSKIQGLLLLDPLANEDEYFKRRRLLIKLKDIHAWPRRLRKLLSIGILRFKKKESGEATISLRDPPTDEDIRMCFEALVKRDGKVLAIFTSLALSYYNESGQLVRSTNVKNLDSCCKEIFWPQMGHLYPVQHHREQLIGAISDWAAENLNHFKAIKKIR